MKILLLSPVESVSFEQQMQNQKVTEDLQAAGHEVITSDELFGHRSDLTGIIGGSLIVDAVKSVDEVHVLYTSQSELLSFAIGISFAFGRKLVLLEQMSYNDSAKNLTSLMSIWSKTPSIAQRDLHAMQICHENEFVALWDKAYSATYAYSYETTVKAYIDMLNMSNLKQKLGMSHSHFRDASETALQHARELDAKLNSNELLTK